ncbi:MAG TPA: MBL fold metallo-hydrolase [Myxococcota bacterium]|nr:MBL fold metallo-hydrolase [Myxococcota bacterium]HRY95272.1 MBL fold metallo-hydrolase [Myxococcota bacterium]HSA22185.1 MBL fold metallo-hydrolase [Myxococcota bacterium]
MRVTILGSGTSSGVPVIGCECRVCTSPDPRDRRTRASAVVALPGGNLLLDTATDLRAQALREGLVRVDAVLFTHAHADHLHGIDELRLFNLRRQGAIPCFGNRDTLERLRAYLRYIFDAEQGESWRPALTLTEVTGPFELLGARVVPIPLWHGRTPVLGYRLGGFAYLTDANRIPDESWGLLEGLEVLVLDALREKPHPTHFSLGEALEVVARLRPGRTVLTHLAHTVAHAEVSARLPAGVELAQDGLVLALEDRPETAPASPRGGALE